MIGCLCIHGFTGGPYEIEPLTSFLSEETDWLVVTPTLPGHGLNLQLDDVTHEDWLEAADQAYQELATQVDQIYLIGFSMGGMIAAYLAAKYPVKGLVMLSPSRKYLSLSKIASEVRYLVRERFFGEIENNLVYQNLQHKKGLIPARAYVEFAKCIAKTRPFLKEITCPVLVLQGIQDGLVPYQTTHDLANEIPVDIDVIYYADSKHLICLGDDKDLVIQTVYDYLIRNERVTKEKITG